MSARDVMDGSSSPSSVPPKTQQQQQPPASSPGSASNLDSFFKRLGQGQSSRLWAGPAGRPGAGAVPGSLRTSRLHPRNGDRDGSRPAAAAAAAVDNSMAGKGASSGVGDDGGAAAGNGEPWDVSRCRRFWKHVCMHVESVV